MKRPDSHQAGQAVVEFTVVTVLVGLVLFWPWLEGRSAADWLRDAFLGLGDSLRVWWAWT